MGVFSADKLRGFSTDDLTAVFQDPARFPGMDDSDRQLLTEETQRRTHELDVRDARTRFSAFTLDQLEESFNRFDALPSSEREALLSETFSRKGDMGFNEVSRLNIMAKHGDDVGSWEAALRPWGQVTDAYQSIQNIKREKRARGEGGVSPSEQAKALAELERNSFNKTLAELELAARGTTFLGKMAGVNQQAAYSSGYALGWAPALGVAALNRTAGLMEPQYRMDFDGNIYQTTGGDGFRTALTKGVIGGGAEVFIEKVGGKLAGQAVSKLGKAAGRQAARIPVAGAAVRGVGAAGKAVANATPQAVKNVLKQSGKVTRRLGIDSLPEELLEEYLQMYPDEMIGLAHTGDENAQTTAFGRIQEAHKDFFKPENAGQMAFELSMMQVMGAGANALWSAGNKLRKRDMIDPNGNPLSVVFSPNGAQTLQGDGKISLSPLDGASPDEAFEALETLTDPKTGKTFSRTIRRKPGDSVYQQQRNTLPHFYLSDETGMGEKDFLKLFDRAEPEVDENGQGMVRFYVGGEAVGVMTNLSSFDAQAFCAKANDYAAQRQAAEHQPEEVEEEQALLPVAVEGDEAGAAEVHPLGQALGETAERGVVTPDMLYAHLNRQAPLDVQEALAQAARGGVDPTGEAKALPPPVLAQLEAAAQQRRIPNNPPEMPLVTLGAAPKKEFTSPKGVVKTAQDTLEQAAKGEEAPHEKQAVETPERRERSLQAVKPKVMEPHIPQMAAPEERPAVHPLGMAMGQQAAHRPQFDPLPEIGERIGGWPMEALDRAARSSGVDTPARKTGKNHKRG